VRRWGRLVAIVATVVVALLLVRIEGDVLLLLFGSTLFAVALNGVSGWLSRHAKVNYKLAVAAIVLVLVAGTCAGALLLGARIVGQLSQLVQRLPQVVDTIRAHVAHVPIVEKAVPPSPSRIAPPSPAAAASSATGAVVALGHAAAAVVVFLFVGLYGALDPSAYPRIALRLVPPRRRARFAQILAELDRALKRWLLGRVIAMATVGVLCSVGMTLLGVPLALGLGVFAGIATFVEYLGAVVSAVPAILLALAQGPMTAVWTAAVFTVAHVLEGYVITPLVTRRMVRLAPAYTLAGQAVMGTLFGVMGLTLATPFLVVASMFVRALYVEDLLGDREPPVEEAEPRAAGDRAGHGASPGSPAPLALDEATSR